MSHAIIKHHVKNPLLRKYIKFFWELNAEHMQLNHKLIPQRNINLRFNLSGTPQYISINNEEHLLENVFFSGLQDHNLNAHLKMDGKVNMLGVCFFPDGFYPFSKIPTSEFKNQLPGAGEIGLKQAITINEKLMETRDTSARLDILENELIRLLNYGSSTNENFRQIFNSLKQSRSSLQLAEFCRKNNIGMRTLERMFNKYIGVSAMTFVTLNRFQNSLNQILYNDYSLLSDIAFENGYYDQMHFIKEFKRFAGDTPKNFVRQNNSILQIGKLS